MNWIIASMLMFVCSVVMYLAIRKAQLIKISIRTYSLFLFGVPAVILFFLNFGNFFVPIQYFLVILFGSILFSYASNYFIQKAVLLAPNPGYPLMISKSYVVFTTIVSIFLFGAGLTVKRACGILLIVVFSGLIVYSKQHKKAKEHWFLYSMGAFFGWALLALNSKFLLDRGVEVLQLLFYGFSIVTICLLIEIRVIKQKIRFNKKHLWLLLLIGLTSMLFNIFMQEGFKTAPNIGYVNAVNTSSIAVVTIFSILLFKDEFSWKKLIGVFGVVVGLVLLIL